MTRSTVGRAAYAALFAIVVPALLAWWAWASTHVVPLPALPNAWVGFIPVVLGTSLLTAGMWALWRHGHGLPMNAYPPSNYVTRGVYRFTAHPIYVGFVLLVLGASVLAESPSGLWLVTPAVALACAALVLGYERHDLRRRFGPAATHKPLLALPPATSEAPTGWDRASIFVLVLLPWCVAFEAVVRLGVPADAVEAYLPFERQWPVLEWTEAIYGSVYLLVLSAPFVAPTRRALRYLALTALVATAGVTLFYLTVPLVAPPRQFEPQTVLGRMLMAERAMSHTVAAFPAFHVIWSFIAADAWAARSRSFAIVGWTWALLISVSCLTTGMHALIDLLAGVLAFVVVRRYADVWDLLRRGAESMADSWREWRWGPVRFINHGCYAALGGVVGFTIAASFAGPRAFGQILFVHFAGLIGAGLWAQRLEGSPRLSRPFGYYGGVVGVVTGAIVAGAVGGNTMLLVAALALAAPWVQAIGRARCLVQGCCHGSQAPEGIGIRYWRERSRVCTLGGLRGVPLHPTPLYSMLTNAVTGIVLLRLWSLGAATGLIGGVYFMLAGVARFVEESYRGEPQTIIVGGLRIYQWLAIASFVGGLVLTTVPSAAAPGLPSSFDVWILVAAALFGAAAGFSMGVDFPGSSRRFARLADP